MYAGICAPGAAAAVWWKTMGTLSHLVIESASLVLIIVCPRQTPKSLSAQCMCWLLRWTQHCRWAVDASNMTINCLSCSGEGVLLYSRLPVLRALQCVFTFHACFDRIFTGSALLLS